MEVDERERQCDAVSERVDQPSELEELYRARQPRIETAEGAEHRQTLAAVGSAPRRRACANSVPIGLEPFRPI